MSAPGPAQLLAKSTRGRAPVTLEAHLRDTERAAGLLFGGEGRWGESFLRFFGLPASFQEKYLTHLRLAALFHDLGKANEDFLAAANGRLSGRQTLRHEHLSALVLHLTEVRQWLQSNPEIDWEIVTAAVLSHHFKASMERRSEWAWGKSHRAPRLGLFLGHPEVVSVLRHVGEVAGLPEPPALPGVPWQDGPPWTVAFAEGVRAARGFREALRADARRRSLLLATKAGLIAADAAASAIVREGRRFEWLEEVARAEPISAAELDAKVLRPRIEQLERSRKQPFRYHRFQEEAARQGPRVLLLAACGAGKTLAAWRWAQEQLQTRPAGRVVFLYPTRGTATEGFRDYISWAPEADAALVHGQSRYELEAMASNPDEPSREKRFFREEDARMFALAYWSKRLFSATVDQFLGFMEHAYASMCLLPVLADSVLIIDEVHSFAPHMFDVLVAFLKAFDLPVLCMTATLPPRRREALEEVGLTVFPRADQRGDLPDLEAEERRPRYRLEPVAGEDEALARAAEAYRSGRRVLWVVNQVARCQRLARRAREMLGEGVLCYHSRFRLEDRQDIHRKTVDAFKQSGQPAFAVTTQVCEMSLDLDADVLVTEVAPVTALVQRFGRANRRSSGKAEDFRARLWVYPPETAAPYEMEDLLAAERFLKDLEHRELSQRELADALERRARSEPMPEGSASFLEGGYFATPGALRDGDEWAESCVIDADLERARALRAAGKPFDGLIVPVPSRFVLRQGPRPTWLPKHLGIAEARCYDAGLGFLTEGEV